MIPLVLSGLGAGATGTAVRAVYHNPDSKSRASPQSMAITNRSEGKRVLHELNPTSWNIKIVSCPSLVILYIKSSCSPVGEITGSGREPSQNGSHSNSDEALQQSADVPADFIHVVAPIVSKTQERRFPWGSWKNKSSPFQHKKGGL